jgi:hypothetical protein
VFPTGWRKGFETVIKPLTRAELTEFAIRRLAKKYPELVRERWDFTTCPDEELGDCRLYEFKSQSTYARQEILAWRQTCNAKSFDEFLWLARRTLTAIKYGQLFYALWPEWPNGPFLGILPDERKRRRELFGPNTTVSRAAELTPPPVVPGGLSQSEADFILGLIGQSEVEYFRIDLQTSDREIHRQLDLWLKINRKCKAKPNVSHRSLRADLKALGAHRILEATGGEWREAPEIYCDQREWIKADARAKKLIKRIDSIHPL